MPLTRRQALATFSLAALARLAPMPARAQLQQRADPDYGLQFTRPIEELVGDLETGERGDPLRESSVEHRHWYSHETRRHWGAWGPPPRRYEVWPALESRSPNWLRQRTIAAAARFIGYGYQHHHIPDWNPPSDWPWKETCVGHNGKGLDCSNFTAFVYNQAFGIRLSSSVTRQAIVTEALHNREHGLTIRTIALPERYEDRQRTLRSGDLVYIRGRVDGPITHVVLWVGSVGRSAGSVPLVLDSHGSGVLDEQGRQIPCGVQLRPFRATSWYNRCASHAHRVFAGGDG